MSTQVPSDIRIDRGDAARQRYFSRMMRNPWYANVIIYVLLAFTVVITVVPILNILVHSISPVWVNDRYPLLLWPIEVTGEAYRYIFQTPTIMKAFGISVYRTCAGTLLNLILTVAAAYGATKYEVPGMKAFMIYVVFTMLFGAGLVPFYILIRMLGLMNSYLVYIMIGMVNAFNLVLMRNFILNMPRELEESARIDGASEFQILFRIVVPLMKASIATIGLFYAIGHWNDFWTPLLFITDQRRWSLPLLLRSIIYHNDMTGMGTIDIMLMRERVINPENIQAATIIFATVPIALVYPFLQKHFTKGILIGAIKG
jgi:putative aldouronate transport system permease protein